MPLGCSLQYPCKVKATSLSVVFPRRSITTVVAHSSSLHVENTPESRTSHQGGSVRYGIVTSQGPRETMEDVAHVVEKGPCGFLFASACCLFLYVYIDTVFRLRRGECQCCCCLL